MAVRPAFVPASSLLALLVLSSPASAFPRYAGTALPDLGAGGRVLAVDDYGPSQLSGTANVWVGGFSAAGEVDLPGGGTAAALWNTDNSDIDSHLLAAPGGGDATATAVVRSEDGVVRIVGHEDVPGGVRRAVVWVWHDGGYWAMPCPPFGGFEETTFTGIHVPEGFTQGAAPGFFVTGYGTAPDGQVRGLVGIIEEIPIPSYEGLHVLEVEVNAEHLASGIVCITSPCENLAVVGAIRRDGGTWSPAAWDVGITVNEEGLDVASSLVFEEKGAGTGFLRGVGGGPAGLVGYGDSGDGVNGYFRTWTRDALGWSSGTSHSCPAVACQVTGASHGLLLGNAISPEGKTAYLAAAYDYETNLAGADVGGLFDPLVPFGDLISCGSGGNEGSSISCGSGGNEGSAMGELGTIAYTATAGGANPQFNQTACPGNQAMCGAVATRDGSHVPDLLKMAAGHILAASRASTFHQDGDAALLAAEDDKIVLYAATTNPFAEVDGTTDVAVTLHLDLAGDPKPGNVVLKAHYYDHVAGEFVPFAGGSVKGKGVHVDDYPLPPEAGVGGLDGPLWIRLSLTRKGPGTAKWGIALDELSWATFPWS